MGGECGEKGGGEAIRYLNHEIGNTQGAKKKKREKGAGKKGRISNSKIREGARRAKRLRAVTCKRGEERQ